MRYLSVLLAVIYHFIIHVPRQKEIFTTLTVFSVFTCGGATIVYWLDISPITRFIGEFSDEIVSILILKTVYNGFRLHQFPGSWLWKLTDLTYVCHATKGDLDYRVYDLHRKYGDVVRIQPNHLSFTNIEALRDIYGFQAKAVKGDMYVNIFQLTGASNGQNLFSSVDRQYHDKFRRIFGPAFSNSALMKHESKIREHLDKVVRIVGASASQGPVEMTSYCKYFVMDVSAELALGEQFNTVEQDEYRPLIKKMETTVALATYFEGFDIVGPLFGYLMSLPSLKAVSHFETMIVGLAKKSLDKGIKSIISDLTGEISSRELASHGSLFLLAGADPTGNALSIALWHLVNCKRARKKLCEEIRAFSLEELTAAKLSNLPYLNAVLNESFRMTPVVSTGLRREVPEDCTIGGYHVPAGTVVSVPIYAFHNLESHFENPHEYIPERWLDGQHSAFMPFLYGPMGCIGKNLANIEMRMYIARLIWEFDLELEYDNAPIYKFGLVHHTEPIYMRVTRRQKV